VKYQRALSEWRYLRKTWKVEMESGDQFHNPNLQFGWSTFEIPAPSGRETPWTSIHLSSLKKK
jgi:hypothetical protein